MELVVHIGSGEALEAGLVVGVGGVSVRLPRHPDAAWWAEARSWGAAVRARGIKFYLTWDWLLKEKELPRALEYLAAITELQPDGLTIRDLGLCAEARRRYPGLPLKAAANWGCHNALGLRQIQDLGFSRAVLDAPLSLQELALMRREAGIPLEVALPPACPGYAGLCLLEDYLGIDCAGCGALGLKEESPGAAAAAWGNALERLPGLARLGVEAVQLGGVFFQGEPLRQVAGLFQGVLAAPPQHIPKALAAARQIFAAFGESLVPFRVQEGPAPRQDKADSLSFRPPGAPGPPRGGRPDLGARPRVWLEARSFAEAAPLAREWPGTLVVPLTPGDYRAFLPQHRRWAEKKRLIWRLPAVLRQADLPFYRQALTTLRDGGHHRMIAGDWGAVALARDAGAEIYGDETLGVRNSWAVAAGRALGVRKFCLPPGVAPTAWQDLLNQTPPDRFWGYLYHLPALAVCPQKGGPETAGPFEGPGGQRLRWWREVELAMLYALTPINLEHARKWLAERGVSPLVASLTRSDLPSGRVPALLQAKPPDRRRPAR